MPKHFAEDRKPEEFLLIGLVHQQDPDSETCESESQQDRGHHQAKDAGRQASDDRRKNNPDNPKSDPSDIKENRLESVKANERVRLVRVENQKRDSRDEAGEVGERCREICIQGFRSRLPRRRHDSCARRNLDCRRKDICPKFYRWPTGFTEASVCD